MKLVASMMVGHNEADRYLTACVEHLLVFCDEVVVRYEHADELSVMDGRVPTVLEQIGVVVLHAAPSFYAHEGRARQQLLDATLDRDPSHILSIDADEFIANGYLLRDTLERIDPDPREIAAYPICIQEVWGVHSDRLALRQDGGWEEHDVPVVWTPGPRIARPTMTMPDRALACGRTPLALAGKPRRQHTGTALLHFGWARQAERQARYDRYVEHDGGRFHSRSHLDSIMWDDSRITLNAIPWPTALAPWKDSMIAFASGAVGVTPEMLREFAVVALEQEAALAADAAIVDDPEDGPGIVRDSVVIDRPLPEQTAPARPGARSAE